MSKQSPSSQNANYLAPSPPPLNKKLCIGAIAKILWFCIGMQWMKFCAATRFALLCTECYSISGPNKFLEDLNKEPIVSIFVIVGLSFLQSWKSVAKL